MRKALRSLQKRFSNRAALVSCVACFGVMFLLGEPIAYGQPNALGSLAQGEPVVANTTGNMGATASSSALFLDVSKFSGTDICGKINTIYNSANFPTTGGILDARAFSGAVGSQSNPFAGANKGFLLMLGPVQIVTSVPWVTPQQPHRIVGMATSAAPSSSTGNNTLIQACGPQAINWNGSTMKCGAIPQFPTGTGAYTLPFTIAHGPFPLPTGGNHYAAVINDGGIVSSSAGDGWGTTALEGRVENVFLDCGGCTTGDNRLYRAFPK